jgi:hypothetical protein
MLHRTLSIFIGKKCVKKMLKNENEVLEEVKEYLLNKSKARDARR